MSLEPEVREDGYVPLDGYVKPLLQEWRRRAAERRREGAAGVADLYELLAGELEAAQTTHRLERLGAAQAARESGFTARGIRKLRSEGRISDRREDLPRHPGHGVTRALPATPSIAGSGADALVARVRSAQLRRAS